MRRREFIAAIALTTIAVHALAQQAAKIYCIAIVDPLTPLADQSENRNPLHRGISEELRRFGYIEGQNLAVERYSSDGRAFRNPELARDVVQHRPDAIVAISNPAALDFKATMSAIPIIAVTADPVALGIVESLARPGGNITGVSVDAGIGMWSKRLELVREVAPNASRMGFLGSRAAWEGPYGATLREAARGAGLSLIGVSLNPPFDEGEYRRVFQRAMAEGMEALVVSDLPYNFVNRSLLAELCATARLPAIYSFREAVESGGLLAYAFDQVDIGRHVADHVDRILHGAKPGDVPIEQPTQFLTSINLKTAAALGITVPPSLLARADEVIE